VHASPARRGAAIRVLGGRRSMLNDGGVDHELEWRRLVAGWGCLGDQCLQQGGDDGVVPVGGGGVVVGLRGGEGGFAGLSQAY
jgi:hypothetical protein